MWLMDEVNAEMSQASCGFTVVPTFGNHGKVGFYILGESKK